MARAVHIPVPKRDRPNLWALSFTGLGSLCFGLSIALFLYGGTPARYRMRRGLRSSGKAMVHYSARVPQKTLAKPVEVPRKAGKLERQRVAYFRCGQQQGRERECPRDKKWEESVWLALEEGLLRCPSGATASGDADIRLEFPGVHTVVRAVPWSRAGMTKLREEQIVPCVQNALQNLQPVERHASMVVSFRMGLILEDGSR